MNSYNTLVQKILNENKDGNFVVFSFIPDVFIDENEYDLRYVNASTFQDAYITDNMIFINFYENHIVRKEITDRVFADTQQIQIIDNTIAWAYYSRKVYDECYYIFSNQSKYFNVIDEIINTKTFKSEISKINFAADAGAQKFLKLIDNVYNIHFNTTIFNRDFLDEL